MKIIAKTNRELIMLIEKEALPLRAKAFAWAVNAVLFSLAAIGFSFAIRLLLE